MDNANASTVLATPSDGLAPLAKRKSKRPTYSERLLDKLILIAAEQTARVRSNPDDAGYAAERSTALETAAWAMFQARERMQERRRTEERAAKCSRPKCAETALAAAPRGGES
jgi:hypothetical protein